MCIRDRLNRTRQIIQSSATSACNSLATQPNQSNRSFQNQPNRSSPNHRERISFGKRRKVETKMITHELQVLRSRTTTSTSEYPYANSDVIIKEVYLNLNTELKESEICFKIKDACSRKLPSLNENSFEFVKRVMGR